jgi:hypothetical protein
MSYMGPNLAGCPRTLHALENPRLPPPHHPHLGVLYVVVAPRSAAIPRRGYFQPTLDILGMGMMACEWCEPMYGSRFVNHDVLRHGGSSGGVFLSWHHLLGL